MPYVPPTSHRRTRLKVRPVTTPRLRDSQGSPLWHCLSRLEDATREASMVRSLYVQIGVLNWQSWIIVNATGGPQTSASLTLAMPHGPLFQMHRFRRDSSKLPLHQPVVPMKEFTLYPQPESQWYPLNRLWRFLTRG